MKYCFFATFLAGKEVLVNHKINAFGYDFVYL